MWVFPTTRTRSQLRGRPSGVLQADSVIHRMAQLLLAPEISLGCLNRRMTQKKLDLLEFSSRQMTKSRACTAEIVWSEVLDSRLACRSFDDMPDCFGRDPFSLHLPESVYSAKDGTLVGIGSIGPIIHG